MNRFIFNQGVKWLFALLLLAVPFSVQALEVYINGGLAAGYAARQQTAPANDLMDSGEKVYLGSRLLGLLGVEVAYYNLGKYNSGAMEVTAVGADAVFMLDVRGMTLFVKGGLMDWKETDLVSAAVTSGQDVTYGLGINLAVDKHVLFRTELEFFKNIGKDSTTGDPGSDMSMLSFGVNFQF